jgi:hypothetical protein
MIKEYKGCEIEFDEPHDCFVAYKNGERFAENSSFAKLKEQIDMLTKKVFQRLPIYFNNTAYTITEGEISSFNSIQKEVWVIYGKDKQRGKKSLRYDSDHLVHKTKDNLIILQEIQKITLEVERLEKKKERLLATLVIYTYDELCKITGQTKIEG